VHQGYTIPDCYHPMISKLIVWERNRTDAIKRMRRALSEYIIVGVDTNIALHKAIMENPRFVSGDLDTDFISRRMISAGIDSFCNGQQYSFTAKSTIHKDLMLLLLTCLWPDDCRFAKFTFGILAKVQKHVGLRGEVIAGSLYSEADICGKLLPQRL
jgi:hypothetical protein